MGKLRQTHPLSGNKMSRDSFREDRMGGEHDRQTRALVSILAASGGTLVCVKPFLVH